MDEASEVGLFRALRRLIEHGVVRVELDLVRLDHIDSPVAVEADSNIWIYGLVFLCAVVFWTAGPFSGLATIAVSLALYLTLGRAYVRRRLAGRVHERALGDSETWRRLWRFGGVTLVVAEAACAGLPGEAHRCAAPAGNWMGLVRALATCSAADC